MTLDETLREFVKGIVQEVVAECGQTSAPQLYDVDQAAARLRVSKRWLYERTAAGAIPFRKVGKYLRFSDSDLLQIAERTSGE
jgi:excisionase family DNA binding protein